MKHRKDRAAVVARTIMQTLPSHLASREVDAQPRQAAKSKDETCKHAWGITALKRRTENVERHDDYERRKTMSTKSKIQSSKADPPVNSVVFELDDEYATTTAAHRKAGTGNA